MTANNELRTILYVDDEPDICEIFADILEGEGYKVLKAHSGNEALRVLKNNRVDAVVSDIQMPNGDGIYLLNEIKKKPNRPPLIFTTGFAPVTREQTIQMGAFECISKPFSMELLTETLKNALAGGTPTAPEEISPDGIHYIYYAEDRDEDFDVLVAALSRLGIQNKRFNVVRFKQGETLLKKLNEEAESSQPPSLFLLDINMPGITGIETLKEIRQNPRYKTTPAIILTSSNLPVDRDRAAEAKASAFHTKPSGVTSWQHLVHSWEQSWLRPPKA